MSDHEESEKKPGSWLTMPRKAPWPAIAIAVGLASGLIGWGTGTLEKANLAEAVRTGREEMEKELKVLREQQETDLQLWKLSITTLAADAAKTASKATSEAQAAITESAEANKLAAAARATAKDGLAKAEKLRDDLEASLSAGGGATLKETLAVLLKDEGSLHDVLAEAASAPSLPIGTICAFLALPAENSPWRICDGTSVAWNEDLWLGLRGRFGNADTERAEIIVLPDFQGYFLRGYDPDGEYDKERGRTDMNIGSKQLPGVGGHTHPLTFSKNVFKTANHGDQHSATAVIGAHNTLPDSHDTRRRSEGTTLENANVEETRPRNIAVHWVIRVK